MLHTIVETYCCTSEGEVTEGCTLGVGELQRQMKQRYAVSKIITHKVLTPTHFLRL
jgi:hypothetical protein